MSNALIVFAILTAALYVGVVIGRRVAAADQRVNADIAFVRAIPADMDWGQR